MFYVCISLCKKDVEGDVMRGPDMYRLFNLGLSGVTGTALRETSFINKR